MSDFVTPKAIAVVCDTTAKRIRSFIRACDEKGMPIVNAAGEAIVPVGAGNHYAFTKDDARAIISAFAKRPSTQDRRSAAVVKADVLAWLEANDDDDDDDATLIDDDDDDAEGDEG